MMLRIRVAAPDAAVTPAFIESALESTTLANQALMAQGAPTASALLAKGARWRPEPYGDGEHFDTIDTIGQRGWGDCDDWAPALAAEYRVTGADPGARAVIRRTGDRRWHALTQLSDGTIVDPSLWAGMPSVDLARSPVRFGVGQAGAVVIPAGRRGWMARCDLPVMGGHLVGVGWGCPDPFSALYQAVSVAGAGHPWGEDVCRKAAAWSIGIDPSDIPFLPPGVAQLLDTVHDAATAMQPQPSSTSTPLPPSPHWGLGVFEPHPTALASALDAASSLPSVPPAPSSSSVPSQSAMLPGGGLVSWGPRPQDPIVVRFA